MHLVERLVARDSQFALQMQIGTGQEDMDARVVSLFQSCPGPANVRLSCPGQAGDHRASDLARDQTHGIEVVFRSYREAGFNDVYAQTLQLAGEAQLVVYPHAAARGLLAVPQAGVKNPDAWLVAFHLVAFGHRKPSFCPNSRQIFTMLGLATR